jgi:flagellar hook-basal body complex protein FliE
MAIAPIGGVGIDAISLYRSLPQYGAGAASGPDATAATGQGGGFGKMIADRIQGAVDLQDQGAAAAQALATGTASDVSAATISVEKAAISLQLVGAFRNKAVEAYQDVMRMQI